MSGMFGGRSHAGQSQRRNANIDIFPIAGY
jgi:hypothetical protein